MDALPLEVRPHPTKRRALFVTRRFSPSELIHVFQPLLLTVASPSLGRFCSYCLKPGEGVEGGGGGGGALRGCSRCHQSFYCGAECQALDWKAVHSRECKQMQRLPALPPPQQGQGVKRLPTPVRALVQCLLKKDIADRMSELEGHLEDKRKKGGKEWEELTLMAMGACAYSGKGQDPLQLAKAQELLAKFQTNVFHQSDDANGRKNIFLEPTLAMANHSCMPNASVRFIGRTAILTAEAEIKTGDEIEISYIDSASPLARRREYLAGYFFRCRCRRCEQDLNVYQVAAESPLVSLNWYSVLTDEAQLRRHPGSTDPQKIRIARELPSDLEGIQGPDWLGLSLVERRRLLREKLHDCKALMEQDLWAVSPLTGLIEQAANLWADVKQYAEALVLRCFISTACDPYRRVNPGDGDRVANLALICRLLSQTAFPGETSGSSSKVGIRRKIEEALEEIDQVSLCQMLLVMVVKYRPEEEYLRMLEDIDRLEGRERELSLINAWREDARQESSRAFFDFAVVKPVARLAEMAPELVVDIGL